MTPDQPQGKLSQAGAPPGRGRRARVYVGVAVGGMLVFVFGGGCWWVSTYYRIGAAVVGLQADSASLCSLGGAYRKSDGARAVRRRVDQLGGDKPAAEKLCAYLRAPRFIAPAKLHAIELLGGCGEHGVPTLVACMRSGHPMFRMWAARAMAMVGPDGHAAVHDLVKLLADENEETRAYAADALGYIGPKAQSAVSALAILAGTKVTAKNALPFTLNSFHIDHAQANAAWALGRVDPEGKAAVPHLQRLLRSSDDRLRGRAAESLGQMGSASMSAAPSVRRLLQDKNPLVRLLAAHAHFLITGDMDLAVESMRRLHDSLSRGNLKIAALHYMAQIGARSTESPASFFGRFIEADGNVRYSVATYYGLFGRKRMPALADALKHSDARIRQMAVRAIAGTQDTQLAKYLRSAQRDENSLVRQAATEALRDLEAGDTPIRAFFWRGERNLELPGDPAAYWKLSVGEGKEGWRLK